jgi:glutaconyl-CoA/methylmalonyl-CoA decarboxylase subunit gamma
MGRYELVIDGVPMTVEILSIAGSIATVSVNGVTLQVELPPGATVVPPRPSRHPPVLRPVPAAPKPTTEPAPQAPPAERPTAATAEAVLAPMPGSVVRVLVDVGDHVHTGTPVVLMEAMKMENEIRAHVGGRVSAIRAKAGQTVKVNEVLVVIDPKG